jgi:hypothetical protein
MGTHFISNKDIGDTVSAAISQARSEICLTSPWVIGERLPILFSEDVKNRIREGEVRLQVVIRLRELSDMEITNATTFNFLREIGAEFRFSSQLHAKLVTKRLPNLRILCAPSDITIQTGASENWLSLP